MGSDFERAGPVVAGRMDLSQFGKAHEIALQRAGEGGRQGHRHGRGKPQHSRACTAGAHCQGLREVQFLRELGRSGRRQALIDLPNDSYEISELFFTVGNVLFCMI